MDEAFRREVRQKWILTAEQQEWKNSYYSRSSETICRLKIREITGFKSQSSGFNDQVIQNVTVCKESQHIARKADDIWSLT